MHTLKSVTSYSPSATLVFETLFPKMSISESKELYIGLDLSTQQLKCTIIDERHRIVLEKAVNFDKDLPEFGTVKGVIKDGEVVTSPTLMWVKSVDILMEKLKEDGFEFRKVKGISGASQQHGSVYWSDSGIETLSYLDTSLPLHPQFETAFTMNSPIWQDTSTKRECRALEDFVGGPQALAELTGSRAHERFTGNQIARRHTEMPEEYARTEKISLISSFLASLFLGKLAAIDVSDGSGMNLMNLRTRKWDPRLLEFCGGVELKDKLGPEPAEGGKCLGRIDEYWVERYGFDKDCKVIAFTGDNPATLTSMSLLPGDCVISLGTSDTCLLPLREPQPTADTHTLAHPTNIDSYMAMLAFQNGSLTREIIRNTYTHRKWSEFEQVLATTKPGCVDGKGQARYGFFFYSPEIIPAAKGIWRFEDGKKVAEFSGDPKINARAVLEAQFLSMRVRIARMLSNSDHNITDALPLKRIIATGGTANNVPILQVLADVLGLPVTRKKGVNSASLGGAILAKFGVLLQRGEVNSFEMMMRAMGDSQDEVVAEPRAEATKFYENMIEEFIRLEGIVVGSNVY